MSENGQPVEDPKLPDVLQRLKSDVMKSINCCKVGAIESFDAEKRTAKVQVAFKRTVSDPQTKGTKVLSFPVLVDVPVVTLQGGGGALTFPIAQGDECLLFFADANIDAWFQNGGQATPFDGRRHDPSDAFALIGVNSLANALQPTVVDGEVALAFGQAKVGLKDDKVTIAAAGATLLTVLTGLIDVLKTLQVEGPLPLTSASIAALELYKLQIEALTY
jgi:hypothetical protein